jgi:ketosteroid isomerase-like protein
MRFLLRSLAALAAAVVVFGLPACAAKGPDGAATFTAEDSLAVQASTDKWIKGSLERNYDLFAESITPDVILYPGNAPPVRGREAALAFVKTYPPMSSFVVNVAELTGRGDVAFDHGTYTSTMTLPNGTVVNDTGSFAAVFKRQADGSWAHHRVIFHSSLPPAPPAPATPASRIDR